jgi:glycosyltransferase involved in cell wall biosynthesis
VDTRVFHPGDRDAARRKLGLPAEAHILLFCANGGRANPYKDYGTMWAAVRSLTVERSSNPLLFVVVGDEAPAERVGDAGVRFVGLERSASRMALYYQAADSYIHAARSEVWGLTVTEALACGTPVVATAVGGIPEQIRDTETGFLTPPGDAGSMAEAIQTLLDDDERRSAMGAAAGRDAADRFSLEQMASNYLQLYREVVQQGSGHSEH